MAVSRESASLAYAALAGSDALRKQIEEIGGKELLEWIAPATEVFAPPSFSSTGRGALTAATRYSFVTEDLEAPDPDISALLAMSATTVVGGSTRLKLADEERGVILDAATGGEALVDLLANTAVVDEAVLQNDAADTDAMVSAWLRTFLRGSPVRPGRHSTKRLSAAYNARTSMRTMTRLSADVPTAAELKRRLDLAELIEPLRIIVGLGDPSDILRKDRFAGRAEEMAELRSFVDELDSESLLEGFSRTVTRVGRSIATTLGGDTRARMLMLFAGGGLGKSTLIAKFFLDHALGKRSFPFAYLDFDRSTIQPRSPEQLLIETARQVAVVYPDLASPLGRLREELRRGLADGSAAGFSDLCGQFREIIRRSIADSPARCFLLVLDTVEVIQTDPAALFGVKRFLTTLAELGFPELAIVVSGRREVSELSDEPSLWSARLRELEPLTIADAVQMVDLLGESLSTNWPRVWSVKIVGQASDPSIRREPLTLRVAFEIVRNAEAERRGAIVDEIAKLGIAADTTFVGKLYEKRVLDHVGDERARKLAWPGLVVRRITREIATQVIAPICGMSADDASVAFDRLGQEVWIVDRDGDGLRHRADLRSRTLPLMRFRDPEQFRRLASAMVDYLEGPSSNIENARAEAIYYRLLRGDDPSFLEAIWSADLEHTLSGTIDDFEPESSVAVALSGRLSQGPLPREVLARLTLRDAWDHLARAGSSLRLLDDSSIDGRVLDLVFRAEKADREKEYLKPAAAAARQSLLIKAGAWDLLDQSRAIVPESQPDRIVEALFSNLTVAAGSLSPEAWLTSARLDPLASRRAGDSWPVLAFSLYPALSSGREVYDILDRQIASALSNRSAARLRSPGALRCAMMFGTECLPNAVDAYVNSIESGDGRQFLSHGSIAASISPDELTVMVGDQFPETSLKSELANYSRSRSNAPSRIDDAEIVGIAFEFLRSVGRRSEVASNAIAVRSFAAARLEGWATPVGYALAREARFGFWSKTFRGNPYLAPERITDEIGLASSAEEAGELLSLVDRAAIEVEESAGKARLHAVGDLISTWQRRSQVAIKSLSPLGGAASA
jgi:hypothetical protein